LKGERKLSKLNEMVNRARSRTLEILKVDEDEVEKGLDLHRKSIVIDTLVPHGAWIFNEKMLQKTKELIEAGRSAQYIDEEIKCMEDFEVINEPEAREAYSSVWDTYPMLLDGSHTRSSNSTCLRICL
jgi:hypothetical protein